MARLFVWVQVERTWLTSFESFLVLFLVAVKCSQSFVLEN